MRPHRDELASQFHGPDTNTSNLDLGQAMAASSANSNAVAVLGVSISDPPSLIEEAFAHGQGFTRDHLPLLHRQVPVMLWMCKSIFEELRPRDELGILKHYVGLSVVSKSNI